MRLLSAACAIALFATLASSGQAQPAADKSKDATKVYAYKQRAPGQTSNATGTATAEPTLVRPSFAISDPNSVPYGSARWWEIQERASGGHGGGGS